MIRQLRALWPSYAKNALTEVYTDRAMFLTDFFLATSIPYLVQWLLWHWVFAQRASATIFAYTQATMLAYYAYAIAFNRMNNGYSLVESIARTVQTGQLSALCCKPVPFFRQRLADFLGGSVPYCLPIVAVWLAVQSLTGLEWRSTLTTALLLLLLLPLSQILCFQLSFVVAMTSLRLTRVGFLLSLLSAVQVFFGGVLLPYCFWPAWLVPVMRYNPFRYTVAAPCELLLHFSWPLLTEYLVGSAVYIAGLQLVIRWTWPILLRRSIFTGG